MIYGFHYSYTPNQLKENILKREKRPAINEDTIEVNPHKFCTQNGTAAMLIYKGQEAVDLIENDPCQYLDFQKHALTKYYPLAVCKRCCELGGHSNYLICEKPVICYKCGGRHNAEGCTASRSGLRCARCIEKYGLDHQNVVHSALSLSCWTRKFKMQDLWTKEKQQRGSD